MKRISGLLIIVMLLGLSLPLLASAQEQAPIEMARDFPPKLRAQIKLLRDSAQVQKMVEQENEAHISNINEKIRTLTDQLPVELRFANEDVRSQLIGDVLRELMSGRLEVASQEEAIVQYTLALEKSKKNSSKADELRERRHQIQIRANEQKVAAAQANYERSAKLAQKAAISKSELNMQKYAYELSKMELEHSMLDFEIEQSSRINDIANRIVGARISLQPAKARVAAAEKFLELFAASRDKFESIAELKRTIANLNEKQKKSQAWQWEIQKQITELEWGLNK